MEAYDLQALNRIFNQGTPQEGDHQEIMAQYAAALQRQDLLAMGDQLALMYQQFGCDAVEPLIQQGYRERTLPWHKIREPLTVSLTIPPEDPIRELELPYELLSLLCYMPDDQRGGAARWLRDRLDQGMTIEEVRRLIRG